MENLTQEKLSFNDVRDILISDICGANKDELNVIYKALKKALKKFDRDSFLKDVGDFFSKLFKSKREKCKLIVDDIVDSKQKLTKDEAKELYDEFYKLSEVHRSFFDNIMVLIEMFADKK